MYILSFKSAAQHVWVFKSVVVCLKFLV